MIGCDVVYRAQDVHTEGGCDVIQKWVLYQWRGCDDKDTVGAMSDTGV